MPAKIVTVASLKGGVGKTTVAFALAAAAVSRGMKVIALDLDPTGGLSNVLAKAQRHTTIADVLAGTADIHDALADHPLGIRTVVGSRLLNQAGVGLAPLRSAVEAVRDEADLIILDTQPHEPALHAPLGVADHIIVPTALDILSLKGAALTVGLAQAFEVLDRVRGIAVSNARRPLSEATSALLDSLTATGLAFENVLWFSTRWVGATSGRGAPLDGDLLAMAVALLDEILARESPVRSLTNFIDLARGVRAADLNRPMSQTA